MADLGVFETSHLPVPGIPGQVREEVREHRGDRITLRSFHPSPAGLRALAAGLRAAHEALRGMRGWEIVSALDRVAARWLDPADPMRVRVIPAIAAATGFSPEMVGHALDLEQRSSRGPDLLRALAQELGDAEAVDGFVKNPSLDAAPRGSPWPRRGRARVVGPRVVAAVFSANIPGLPHLEATRALLVKAACLGKVPTGEPVFFAAWCRTVAEESPALGACLAAISLDRDDVAGRDALLGSIDHLVAYGGVEAIAALQEAAPPGLRATWHGHRMGLAAVAREALTPGNLPSLAAALAYDFSLYDQEACLSPVAAFVEEGGEVSPRALAEGVARAMAELVERLPPRVLSLPEAAARRGWLDALRTGSAEVVAAPAGLPFVVALDADVRLLPTPPGRTARIVPVADLDALPGKLAAARGFLQGAALAGPEERIAPLAEALAEAGATRITRPGLMGLPSMMWRHDGSPCLSDLVRFVDWEVAPPGEG